MKNIFLVSIILLASLESFGDSLDRQAIDQDLKAKVPSLSLAQLNALFLNLPALKCRDFVGEWRPVAISDVALGNTWETKSSSLGPIGTATYMEVTSSCASDTSEVSTKQVAYPFHAKDVSDANWSNLPVVEEPRQASSFSVSEGAYDVSVTKMWRAFKKTLTGEITDNGFTTHAYSFELATSMSPQHSPKEDLNSSMKMVCKPLNGNQFQFLACRYQIFSKASAAVKNSGAIDGFVIYANGNRATQAPSVVGLSAVTVATPVKVATASAGPQLSASSSDVHVGDSVTYTVSGVPAGVQVTYATEFLARGASSVQKSKASALGATDSTGTIKIMSAPFESTAVGFWRIYAQVGERILEVEFQVKE